MSIEFKNIRGILSDLDGVWFVGDESVPGATKALARIRERSLPVRFITNTTTRTQAAIADKLQRMGLDIPAGEIITSSKATALYLAKKGTPTCRFFVADAVRPGFSAFAESDTPDCVVVGDLGEGWNYRLMNDAFGMIMDGAELVAMQKGRYWRTDAGLTLDVGAIVAGLEYAAGAEATVVGKPSPTMFRSALSDIGLGSGEVFMIGDDVVNDVGGAQNLGIPGVLVRTGKYREDLVAKSDVTPDVVVDSVADLSDLL